MARMHSRCRKHTGFVRSVRRVWRYRLAALHDGWSWWVSCQREPAAHGVRALSRPRVVDHLQRGDTALRRSSLTRAGGFRHHQRTRRKVHRRHIERLPKTATFFVQEFLFVSPGNHPPSDPDLGHRGRGTQWRDSSLKGAGKWRTGSSEFRRAYAGFRHLLKRFGISSLQSNLRARPVLGAAPICDNNLGGKRRYTVCEIISLCTCYGPGMVFLHSARTSSSIPKLGHAVCPRRKPSPGKRRKRGREAWGGAHTPAGEAIWRYFFQLHSSTSCP